MRYNSLAVRRAPLAGADEPRPARLLEEARAVEYNPCTLDEYRRQKPKEYVELGKLQPDLNSDDLVAKRANAERVRQFSKNLKSINMGHMAMKGATPAQEAAAQKENQVVSKRERMREFARHRVPKPRARSPPPRDDDDDEPIGSARERHEAAAGTATAPPSTARASAARRCSRTSRCATTRAARASRGHPPRDGLLLPRAALAVCVPSALPLWSSGLLLTIVAGRARPGRLRRSRSPSSIRAAAPARAASRAHHEITPRVPFFGFLFLSMAGSSGSSESTCHSAHLWHLGQRSSLRLPTRVMSPSVAIVQSHMQKCL